MIHKKILLALTATCTLLPLTSAQKSLEQPSAWMQPSTWQTPEWLAATAVTCTVGAWALYGFWKWWYGAPRWTNETIKKEVEFLIKEKSPEALYQKPIKWLTKPNLKRSVPRNQLEVVAKAYYYDTATRLAQEADANRWSPEIKGSVDAATWNVVDIEIRHKEASSAQNMKPGSLRVDYVICEKSDKKKGQYNPSP